MPSNKVSFVPKRNKLTESFEDKLKETKEKIKDQEKYLGTKVKMLDDRREREKLFKNLKEDLDKINELLDNLEIDIREDGFYLDGVDVSEEIRKPIVSENVSKIAAIKEVRIKMVDLQRKFSKAKNVILDGRDIGTVVFPNADLKVFLVADARERANRRYKELTEKGENVSLDEIYQNILMRDKIDSTREEAPLKKAEDAIEVDTTSKSIDEVKEEILNLYKNL